MARLKKDAWKAPSLKTEEIEVEDLGGSVLIRELPAEYSAELNQLVQMKGIGAEQSASIDLVTQERLKFAHGVIEDDGTPMFSADEVAEIAKKHGRAFQVVIKAIDGLSDTDSKAVESAVERFPGSGDSETSTPSVADESSAGRSGPAVPSGAGA